MRQQKRPFGLQSRDKAAMLVGGGGQYNRIFLEELTGK